MSIVWGLMVRLPEIVDILAISGSLFYVRNYSCFLRYSVGVIPIIW